MPTEKVEFMGAFGDTISAKIDYPAGELRSWVLFAHGFSIGKDLKPVRTTVSYTHLTLPTILLV